jgi:hypothetical protein
MKRLHYTILCLFLTLILSGCLSSIALNRAVGAYDKAVINAESEQLLVNIARAEHHDPIHFSQVSNIAATFDFRFSAGGTPALTGRSGGMILPTFGGSVAENPTFSISPIEGEEFTKRLLTSFHQNKFALLLSQHFDVDLLLRMVVQEIHLHHQEQQITSSMPDAEEQEHYHHRTWNQRYKKQHSYRNNASGQDGYEMFRRVALHLSAIQDQEKLYCEPITFNRTWTIPTDTLSTDRFQDLEKEFTILYNHQDDTYTLSKEILGPILITNYDPDLLSNEERIRLIDMMNLGIENKVAIDIRPGYIGGEWPITGYFKLRSFHSILNFLAHSLGENKEYHVEKDARTLPIARDENPALTMELILSDTPFSEAGMSVRAYDRYYRVKATGKYSHWNQNAFQLLHILYRMTVTDAPLSGVPSITISK